MPLEDAVGPHRGDVLLRLLRSVESSKRPSSKGLVYAELGVAYGHSVAWLLKSAPRLFSTMHLVDKFELHSMHELVSALGTLHIPPCAGNTARQVQARGVTKVLCGPSSTYGDANLGLQVNIHKTFSHLAADHIASESVDLVFIDA